MKVQPLLQLAAGLLGLAWAGVGAASELSERDFFSELPTVLTVSRLAQPLNEAPGAVTVLERAIIRRSGARELADVLRLVPGYLVGGYNGAHPVAAYHAPIDEYGIRNLVLIDGRPVYSAYHLGGTSRGMMGIMLEDIERIEVLRGSNSAAYGANAMFGVINIVTRHAADTRGTELSLTRGAGGIGDAYARIGWGDTAASFRLSAGRRGDSGFGNAHDDKRVGQMHLRGDLRPAADQEVTVAAGITDLAAGDGFLRNPGNPQRTIEWRKAYVQGQWQRSLSETEAIWLSANLSEEALQEDFAYALDPSVIVSASGRGRQLNLEFHHQRAFAPRLRAAWGVGYKYEEAVSRPLYHTGDAVSIHEQRLFGNLEWCLHPQWLINAGGFAASHSWTGSYFSPRLMVNFLAAPQHALRLGVTDATRTPTLFELAGDVRHYPQNALNLPLQFPPPAQWSWADIAPYLAAMGQPARHYAASGQVGPERLRAFELGYFGNFRPLPMTLDVRVFAEKMRDVIVVDSTRLIPGYLSGVLPAGTQTTSGLLPVGVPISVPLPVVDFVNSGGFVVRGLEYQLRWKPSESTELWLNQTFQSTHWDKAADKPFAPRRATMIALFQKLPRGFDLSIIHQSLGALSWQRAADALPAHRRTDLRIAKTVRIGDTLAEAALAVQAANGDIPAYQTGTGFVFERRAYGTLRLEF